MVNYNNLWVVMKQKKMTKTELRLAAKLSKNEMVSLEVLVRLCYVLGCQLSDICFIPNAKEGDSIE